jgi:hypothetical protein
MTPLPYDRIVLDASSLAASALSFEMQAKTLRTAVHAGVRWIFCPNEDAQRLAGRALFDLTKWHAAAPLSPNAGIDELYGLSLRLRRNRIDLAIVPDAQCRAARVARQSTVDGAVGGVGVCASDTAQLMAALRSQSVSCIFFGEGLDGPGWRDPSALSAVMAKRGIVGFATPNLAHAPGVTNVIHAPDSPRALFRLLRELRPREPVSLEGLAEAA